MTASVPDDTGSVLVHVHTIPLEMLDTIVVLLPSESVAYPSGAVHLFSAGFMR